MYPVDIDLEKIDVQLDVAYEKAKSDENGHQIVENRFILGLVEVIKKIDNFIEERSNKDECDIFEDIDDEFF